MKKIVFSINEISRVRIPKKPTSIDEQEIALFEMQHAFWLANNLKFEQERQQWKECKDLFYQKYLLENTASFQAFHRSWQRANFSFIWTKIRKYFQ